MGSGKRGLIGGTMSALLPHPSIKPPVCTARADFSENFPADQLSSGPCHRPLQGGGVPRVSPRTAGVIVRFHSAQHRAPPSGGFLPVSLSCPYRSTVLKLRISLPRRRSHERQSSSSFALHEPDNMKRRDGTTSDRRPAGLRSLSISYSDRHLRVSALLAGPVPDSATNSTAAGAAHRSIGATLKSEAGCVRPPHTDILGCMTAGLQRTLDIYRKRRSPTLRVAVAPGTHLPRQFPAKDWTLMKEVSVLHSDATTDVAMKGYCYFQLVKGD